MIYYTIIHGHHECITDDPRFWVILELKALDKVVDHLKVRVRMRGEQGGHDVSHSFHRVTHLWDTDHLLETFSTSVVSLQGWKEIIAT